MGLLLTLSLPPARTPNNTRYDTHYIHSQKCIFSDLQIFTELGRYYIPQMHFSLPLYPGLSLPRPSLTEKNLWSYFVCQAVNRAVPGSGFRFDQYSRIELRTFFMAGGGPCEARVAATTAAGRRQLSAANDVVRRLDTGEHEWRRETRSHRKTLLKLEEDLRSTWGGGGGYVSGVEVFEGWMWEGG